MSALRVAVVAGARPNFMKVAPVIRAESSLSLDLVHTGQHYDDQMSAAFFRDLEIRDPDYFLGVGGGSHAEQTGAVMVKFEKYLVEQQPAAVVVVGDVNSTLGAALAAAKLTVPVAHVEAGLRSRDWTMPEEINRVLTDRLSRWLFTTSQDAGANLDAEGIEAERVHFVGNLMIDSLVRMLPMARDRTDAVTDRLGVSGDYAVLTLHRPGNVDEEASFAAAMVAVASVAGRLPVLFPAHPRTRAKIEDVGVPAGVRVTDPLGYLDFLGLMDGSSIVLTDSGGIQEETSYLGIPCITLRPSTERPVTCSLGTNVVVGTDREMVDAALEAATADGRQQTSIPLWDGEAAPRLMKILEQEVPLEGANDGGLSSDSGSDA